MIQASFLNHFESESVKRERKIWFIDVCLYSHHLCLFDFCIFFSFLSFLSCSTSSSFIHFIPFLLFTTTVFYTICHDRIYHFYPSTSFGSFLVSFRDCPLACQLFSHYHCSKCVGYTTLHSQTKLLVLFLIPLCFSLP